MMMKEKGSGVEMRYWIEMDKDTQVGYVGRGTEVVIRGRGYRASRCARRMEVTVTGLEAVVVVGPLR